jgi:lysylphosphatidylglycerol synthetase-like protein (DUF2156 family)
MNIIQKIIQFQLERLSTFWFCVWVVLVVAWIITFIFWIIAIIDYEKSAHYSKKSRRERSNL